MIIQKLIGQILKFVVTYKLPSASSWKFLSLSHLGNAVHIMKYAAYDIPDNNNDQLCVVLHRPFLCTKDQQLHMWN